MRSDLQQSRVRLTCLPHRLLKGGPFDPVKHIHGRLSKAWPPTKLGKQVCHCRLGIVLQPAEDSEATVMFGSESTIEKSVTGGTILSLVTSSASWTLRPTRGVPVASEIVFT